MPPEQPSKIGLGLSALGLLSRLLSFFEAALPAVLVAWNGNLKAKTEAARAGKAIADAELKGEKDAALIAEKTRGLTARQLLDRGVNRARARAKPPTE